MEPRLVHNKILVDGETGTLSGTLIHHTYRSLDSYVAKSAKYAKLSAQEMRKKGRQASLVALFTHPVGMALKMYVMRRGFLDGKEGVFLAVLYSYYTFLKYLYLIYPQGEE